MTDSELLLVAIGASVFVLVVWLAYKIFAHSLAVALNILAWANEWGFVGVALYVLLWVFALPLMLIVCVGGGLLRWLDQRRVRKEQAEAGLPSHIEPGSLEHYQWSNRLGPYEDNGE